MKFIEIYTRPGCGYCDHARHLLNHEGMRFVEYNVYAEPKRRDELFRRTANRTYPQVFIDKVNIGGFEDLLNLKQLNQLG